MYIFSNIGKIGPSDGLYFHLNPPRGNLTESIPKHCSGIDKIFVHCRHMSLKLVIDQDAEIVCVG